MKPVFVLALAAALAGACGGSGSVQIGSEGSCAAVVLWNGVEYTGSATRLPVDPGRRLGEGTVPSCGEGVERTVEVFSIVDVDSALALVTNERDTVYGAPGVFERGADLPAPLVGAFYGPPCSASEPYIVEGTLVGAGTEGGEPLAIGVETKAGYLNALIDEKTLGPNTNDALVEFSGSDLFRLSVSCMAGDRPDHTYHADEIGFVANGPYCARNGNPCHLSFGPLTTVVEGGSEQQRVVLTEILLGIGPTTIEKISVEGATLAFELDDGSALRGEWEMWLVAGAYRDRAEAAALEPVTWLESATGGFRLDGASQRTWPDDLSEVVDSIHRAGEASGWHSEQFAIVRPGGLAPAVYWTVSEPARFLKQDLPKALEAFGDPWRFEGFYFEARDPEGAVFWRWAGSSRLSVGGTFVSPELDACSPIVHSQPQGYDPPPCPA